MRSCGMNWVTSTISSKTGRKHAPLWYDLHIFHDFPRVCGIDASTSCSAISMSSSVIQSARRSAAGWSSCSPCANEQLHPASKSPAMSWRQRRIGWNLKCSNRSIDSSNISGSSSSSTSSSSSASSSIISKSSKESTGTSTNSSASCGSRSAARRGTPVLKSDHGHFDHLLDR